MAPLAQRRRRTAVAAAEVTGIVSHVQLSFANILQHIHSIAAQCAAAAASYIVLVKRKHKVTKVTQV